MFKIIRAGAGAQLGSTASVFVVDYTLGECMMAKRFDMAVREPERIHKTSKQERDKIRAATPLLGWTFVAAYEDKVCTGWHTIIETVTDAGWSDVIDAYRDKTGLDIGAIGVPEDYPFPDMLAHDRWVLPTTQQHCGPPPNSTGGHPSG
ncbi:hypothetical protein ACIRRA_42430 [Nocardia sp. NPDC101769]|uniref:hypothetical protein n=1 Tax=Nocardia sp. NPDC101769 TaxID=3364333 RepID=UPI00380DDCF6